jgi:NAD-dependent dihydropyrimidine dehydrogenase PreA subunit
MKYLSGVSTLTLDMKKCTGCGLCLEVCPHGVFELREGKVVITDADKCMECGACANNCAFGALQVDKGVGCAQAIIRGWITGKEPTCGCDGSKSDNSGCC